MRRERMYRQWVQSADLVSFEVRERQTDLLILADKNLEEQARESMISHRMSIERYIKEDPGFYTSLDPLEVGGLAPDIVKSMARASRRAGVGPMASIAGAIAQAVGRDLLAFTGQVIVENGGDIFLKTTARRTLGVYAGEASPFTGKLALEIGPSANGMGICTSSGTVSHSLSFGNADAALIIADDAALADAAATATANSVKGAGDIETGISLARSIEGVRGVLIIVGDKMGSWGEVRLA